jgi:hypothetical protein
VERSAVLLARCGVDGAVSRKGVFSFAKALGG